MSPELIEQLVGMLKGSSIVEFEYEQASSCVRLCLDREDVGAPLKASQQLDAQVASAVAKKQIVARDIGVLRISHPQRDEPFVMPGAAVQEGQVVAFLQAGEMLREITSTASGILSQPLALEGDLIGYGQAIFELE